MRIVVRNLYIPDKDKKREDNEDKCHSLKLDEDDQRESIMRISKDKIKRADNQDNCFKMKIKGDNLSQMNREKIIKIIVRN